MVHLRGGKSRNTTKGKGKQHMIEEISRRHPQEEREAEMEEIEHNSQFDDVEDEFLNHEANQDEEEVQEPQDPPAAQPEEGGPNSMIQAMEAAFNRMAQRIGGRNEESRVASALRQFKAMDPPIFKGDGEAIEAAQWIQDIEKIYKSMPLWDNDLRIATTTFYLRGEAGERWTSYEEMNGDEDLSWKEFKELVMDEFFPQILREKKKEEFTNLTQQNLTVQ